MVLKEHLARYVLGQLSQGQLPHLAELALEVGYDSPSLRILAGLKPGDWEIDSYWQRTIKEIHLPIPTEDEACTIIQREYALKIIHGETSPLEGLNYLVLEMLQFPYSQRSVGKNFTKLYELFYLDYYYDYLLTPSDYQKLEEQIITAAKEFLALDPASETYQEQPTYEQIFAAASMFLAREANHEAGPMHNISVIARFWNSFLYKVMDLFR